MKKIAPLGRAAMLAKHRPEILRHGGAKLLKDLNCRRCWRHLTGLNRSGSCRTCQRKFGLPLLWKRHPKRG